jgi:hypothetical protein
MAKLTMAQRRRLPKSDFAVPSKAPGPGSYPINDKAHAEAAKRMEHNAPKTQQAKITAKANRKLGKGGK